MNFYLLFYLFRGLRHTDYFRQARNDSFPLQRTSVVVVYNQRANHLKMNTKEDAEDERCIIRYIPFITQN